MSEHSYSWDAYEEVVTKAAASKEDRTTREAEVETLLGSAMPKVLRELLDDSDGSVRPALRDLNDRLEQAGGESEVSPNTFYNWLDKYHLR